MTTSFLATLRRRWHIVVACVVVTTSAVAIITLSLTPQYTSHVSVFVSVRDISSTDPYNGQQFSEARIKSYAELVATDDLARSVIEAAAVTADVDDLVGRVSAAVNPETIILTLSYSDPDPSRAKLLAQTYAEQLTERIAKIEELPGTTDSAVRANIVDKASFPGKASSPNAPLNLTLGALLGLLLGLSGALLRERFDTALHNDRDVLDAIDAPVLARVPRHASVPFGSRVQLTPEDPAVAEAYRTLRTNCLLLGGDRAERSVIALVSSEAGAGVTTTAVNLALAMKESGGRVLLIDGNVRRPALHTRLGVSNDIGLAAVLAGDVALEDAIQVTESGIETLTSGVSTPAFGLAGSSVMADLMQQVRRDYDQVVIDSPPLQLVSDALTLCQHADCTLVVARWGRTTTEMIVEVADHLALVGVSVAGVILNRVATPRRVKSEVGRYSAVVRRGSAAKASDLPSGSLQRDGATGSGQDPGMPDVGVGPLGEPIDETVTTWGGASPTSTSAVSSRSGVN